MMTHEEMLKFRKKYLAKFPKNSKAKQQLLACRAVRVLLRGNEALIIFLLLSPDTINGSLIEESHHIKADIFLVSLLIYFCEVKLFQ